MATYVSNGGDATVSVIDLATNSAVATVAVGQRPWNMALTPDGNKLYVACGRSGSVAVIDTRRNEKVAEITVRQAAVGRGRPLSMGATDSQPAADTAPPRRRRDVALGNVILPAMYMRFFGLKQQPFSLAPDPRYLYMSKRHREALPHLLYGVGGGGAGRPPLGRDRRRQDDGLPLLSRADPEALQRSPTSSTPSSR